MNRVIATHESGVKALLAPRELERAEAVAGDEFRRILAFLAGHFDYVLIDTAPSLDAAGLAALDHADQIVLADDAGRSSLCENSGRFLQLARRLGYPPEKIALVVNRRTCAVRGTRLPEIEKRLGLKPLATIPSSDRAGCLRAPVTGKCLARRLWRRARAEAWRSWPRASSSDPARTEVRFSGSRDWPCPSRRIVPRARIPARPARRPRRKPTSST